MKRRTQEGWLLHVHCPEWRKARDTASGWCERKWNLMIFIWHPRPSGVELPWSDCPISQIWCLQRRKSSFSGTLKVKHLAYGEQESLWRRGLAYICSLNLQISAGVSGRNKESTHIVISHTNGGGGDGVSVCVCVCVSVHLGHPISVFLRRHHVLTLSGNSAC